MSKKAHGGNLAKTSAKAKAKAKVTDKKKANAKAKAKAKAAVEKKTDAKAKAVSVTDETMLNQEVIKIVGEINKLAIETVERGKMDIGDLVLTKVFRGSLNEATSRNPYKSKSMKQVVNHKDLRVDRRRLGEWVRAAFARKELMAKNVDCSNLSYSHFAALLKVDDEKDRKKFAREASKKQWSARKLADEIGGQKVEKVSTGTAQEAAQSPAEKLLEVIGNPLALMEDEETKKLLGSPQDMRHLVTLSVAMRMAERIDSVIASIKDSVNLLELAKTNIAKAFLPDEQVIDVQATEV
jgi:hypothetical protein